MSDQIKLLALGGIAGTVAKTSVAPLERLRIMAQTGGWVDGSSMSTYRRILSEEGIRGLWRGNVVNCIRIFPARGILFSTNDTVNALFAKFYHVPVTALPVSAMFLSGSVSGIIACGVTYPLDVARTRISANMARNSTYADIGWFKTLMRMAKEEGIGSWFRGVTPTLLGALPYEGIKFSVFGSFKKHQPQFIKDNGLSWAYKLFAGAVAGGLAGIIMFPNDTVRRILQMQGSDGKANEYKSTIDCYVKTFQRGGIKRMYHGLTPYLIRMVPSSAIQFFVFESLRPLVHLDSNHHNHSS